MPKSASPRSRATTRAKYTEETFPAAGAGIQRKAECLGLDECVSAQAELRMLLALGFFNHPCTVDAGAMEKTWGISQLAHYTITPSPRKGALVLITNAPGNVAGYLVPGWGGYAGVPGLRPEAYHRPGVYKLRHQATGGLLVVTRGTWGVIPKGLSDEPPKTSPWRSGWATTDTPMLPTETEALAAVPEVSSDARKLLTGLLVRIATHEPGRHPTWAIGNWFSDPLPRRATGRFQDQARRLTGSGDDWELSWSVFPFQRDVVTALTDATIGIPGAVLVPGSDAVVRYGTATLRLIWRPA